MKTTIRVSLSEQASAELLELMHLLGYDSPTHCANKIVNIVHKLNLSPSEEINNDQHPTKYRQ